MVYVDIYWTRKMLLYHWYLHVNRFLCTHGKLFELVYGPVLNSLSWVPQMCPRNGRK